MTFDKRCHDLALLFLSDLETGETGALPTRDRDLIANQMAQDVQEALEGGVEIARIRAKALGLPIAE